MFFVLVCAIFSLAGCDGVTVTKYFTVENAKFDFSPKVVSGTPNNFSATRTVYVSEINNTDVDEYADKVTGVEMKKSSLSITTSPSSSYTITDLFITAVGVSGWINISSCTVGNTIDLSSYMNDFTSSFIRELLRSRSVKVTIKGKTTAPVNTTINFSFKNDWVFSAEISK